MKKGKHAHALLQKANDDLRALQGMLDTTTFTDEIFGFHAQQAVEKALKAWIDSLGLEYPATHDLNVLFSILQGADIIIKEQRYFMKLNLYAVLFRYVTPQGAMKPIDRKQTIEKISNLLRDVAMHLK